MISIPPEVSIEILKFFVMEITVLLRMSSIKTITALSDLLETIHIELSHKCLNTFMFELDAEYFIA